MLHNYGNYCTLDENQAETIVWRVDAIGHWRGGGTSREQGEETGSRDKSTFSNNRTVLGRCGFAFIKL